MKNEKAILAIAAADSELARAGLPTYSQVINQAQQLSNHTQTVQRLTEGTIQGTVKGTAKGAVMAFNSTDC